MSYVDEIIEAVTQNHPGEPEFHQAVKEVLNSLRPVIDLNEARYRREADRKSTRLNSSHWS